MPSTGGWDLAILFLLYHHRNGICHATKEETGVKGGRSGVGSAHMGCFAGQSHGKWWQTLSCVLVRGPSCAGRPVAPLEGTRDLGHTL